MKVACYLRVSTNDQHRDNQRPALESYCQFRNWEIAAVYSENESAWKAGHQKELSRLLSDSRNGKCKVDVVLVWALDRLSREGAAAILNLINTFKAYGIRVISYQELRTEAPGSIGEVLYAIAGWVAKMESERTKAGLARAISQGKKLGRPTGSKDAGKRKRTGYLLRYANKR